MRLEHRRLLEFAADAQRGDRRLVELREVGASLVNNPTGVRTGFAGDDIHHRRLAGPVRPDDRAHLAVFQHQRQCVQRTEPVEADGHAVEVKQGVGFGHTGAPSSSEIVGAGVTAGLTKRGPNSPMTPCGSSKVTPMNKAPRANSQNSGSALVNQVLPKFTINAPRMAPASVPRPPTATQITASIEFAGENSLGLMIPTCGTYSAPPMPAIIA